MAARTCSARLIPFPLSVISESKDGNLFVLASASTCQATNSARWRSNSFLPSCRLIHESTRMPVWYGVCDQNSCLLIPARKDAR